MIYQSARTLKAIIFGLSSYNSRSAITLLNLGRFSRGNIYIYASGSLEVTVEFILYQANKNISGRMAHLIALSVLLFLILTVLHLPSVEPSIDLSKYTAHFHICLLSLFDVFSDFRLQCQLVVVALHSYFYRILEKHLYETCIL